MTKKIGRVMISIIGTALTDLEKVMVAHSHTAAVLLFSRNFQSKAQLKQLVSEIQKFSGKDDLPIFVDQEGGEVQRFIGDGFTKLCSFKEIGQKLIHAEENNIASEVTSHTRKLTSELLEFGIISLTPVADLDQGNSVITGKKRAFSSEPELNSKILQAYVAALNSENHGATLKHFPGHGQAYENGNDDSHICQPVDNRTLAEIEANDLIPFRDTLPNAAAVMPAHIIFSKVDEKNTVGTSDFWINKLLREKLCFKGILVSDCLSMVGSGAENFLAKTNRTLEFLDIAILSNIPPQEALNVLDNLDSGYLDKRRIPYFEQWTRFGKAERRQALAYEAEQDEVSMKRNNASSTVTSC
ncbi:MAG: beta-N-acetylhexosaminidase [Pseudomonadota bacterium]|nr:beta-N-acetylhexosaminidase [Pseudomonadota bacterium]